MTLGLSVRTAIPAFAAILATLLTGCGGSTKTVSVSSPPIPTNSTTAQPATIPPPTSSTTPTTGSAATGGTSTSTTTRTAPAPQFTHGEGSSERSTEGLSGAIATVKAQGYTASDTSDYHPDQTLRVLVATRTGSGDGYDQRAFFFLDSHYVGTDTSKPSAQVKVISQGDTEVTLAYPLYRSSDPECCPGGGQAQVRFQLNNGHLTPLDPIPPVEPPTGLGRR
jgi:hypothetical protein